MDNNENRALLASLEGLKSPSKIKKIEPVKKQQISTLGFSRQQFIEGDAKSSKEMVETKKKSRKAKAKKKKKISGIKKFLKKTTVSKPLLKKSQVTLVIKKPTPVKDDRTKFFKARFEAEKRNLFFK